MPRTRWRRRSYLLAVATLAAAGWPLWRLWNQPMPPIGTDEAALLYATNAARTAAGLPALAADTRLDALAHWRAADLAARGVLEHTDALWDALTAAGIPWQAAGENLWLGPRRNDLAAHVTQAFLDDPPHRAIVLDTRWTHAGMAVGQYDPVQAIVVEVFAQETGG